MSYKAGLINHLQELGLMSDELKSAIDQFNDGHNPVLPFGKYKGKTISEVNDFDYKYLHWVQRQQWLDPVLKDAIDGLL